MPKIKYQVTVTRSDGESASIDVEAWDWEQAKLKALDEATLQEDQYFGPVELSFSIDPMDDDEEAARDPDQ